MTITVTKAVAVLVLLLASSWSAAQTAPATQPAGGGAGVTDPDPTKAIDVMRVELVDAFNKGDLDRLLSHLDSDCVVTWQNGEVCNGPEAVRAYYDKMMKGPNKVVEKVSAAPAVDGRNVHGDWAVSWGKMNDEFELTDGSKFRFDSRFTATIDRHGSEWKVSSFHVSINAFDNPILGMAAKKGATWAAIIAGAVAALVGFVVGRMRRRPADAPRAG
jgi:ketosteroid isomerase-like protein